MNVLAAGLGVMVVVLACFPPVLPVERGNMNYSSVIILGIFGALTLLWFGVGRRGFVGPKVNIEVEHLE